MSLTWKSFCTSIPSFNSEVTDLLRTNIREADILLSSAVLRSMLAQLMACPILTVICQWFRQVYIRQFVYVRLRALSTISISMMDHYVLLDTQNLVM